MGINSHGPYRPKLRVILSIMKSCQRTLTVCFCKQGNSDKIWFLVFQNHSIPFIQILKCYNFKIWLIKFKLNFTKIYWIHTYTMHLRNKNKAFPECLNLKIMLGNQTPAKSPWLCPHYWAEKRKIFSGLKIDVKSENFLPRGSFPPHLHSLVYLWELCTTSHQEERSDIL